MDAAVLQKYRVVVSVITGKGKKEEPEKTQELEKTQEPEKTEAAEESQPTGEAQPTEPEAEDAGVQIHYLARAPEVPGCQAEGATRAEALTELESVLEARIAHMRQEGIEPPVPIDLQDLGGDLTVKVSPDLHRELLFWAKDRGVELDRALPELLARAVKDVSPVKLTEGAPRRDGPRRRGRGLEPNRYHDIMENRADFIEYVRQTERGGGGPGRGGSGQGRGGGRGRGGRGRG